jgi:hypothetical protein
LTLCNVQLFAQFGHLVLLTVGAAGRTVWQALDGKLDVVNRAAKLGHLAGHGCPNKKARGLRAVNQ